LRSRSNDREEKRCGIAEISEEDDTKGHVEINSTNNAEENREDRDKPKVAEREGRIRDCEQAKITDKDYDKFDTRGGTDVVRTNGTESNQIPEGSTRYKRTKHAEIRGGDESKDTETDFKKADTKETSTKTTAACRPICDK